MTLPTNGITPDIIRAVMPPSDATMAWRQERAARLVHEVAGLMPADAPQARIAAEIVIAREAADASFAQANTPGLAMEQVCRLRRIASVLLNSAAVLERTLVRHQQKPAPFFGTVLAEGIDIAALAAGWGGPGSRPDGGAGGSASAGRGRDAGSTPAWTTSRLDQEPGWTLDVVRPRRVDDGAGEDNLGDNAGAAEFRAAERAGGKAASDAGPARL